jgi:hypothetical protein
MIEPLFATIPPSLRTALHGIITISAFLIALEEFLSSTKGCKTFSGLYFVLSVVTIVKVWGILLLTSANTPIYSGLGS